VKVGTNLTQDGVEGLEAAGFTIDDGEDVFDKFAEAFYARQGNVVQPSHQRDQGIIIQPLGRIRHF
jgi:hypothetical protein